MLCIYANENVDVSCTRSDLHGPSFLASTASISKEHKRCSQFWGEDRFRRGEKLRSVDCRWIAHMFMPCVIIHSVNMNIQFNSRRNCFSRDQMRRTLTDWVSFHKLQYIIKISDALLIARTSHPDQNFRWTISQRSHSELLFPVITVFIRALICSPIRLLLS